MKSMIINENVQIRFERNGIIVAVKDRTYRDNGEKYDVAFISKEELKPLLEKIEKS